MRSSAALDCPPIADCLPYFSNLNAIDRIGEAFCQSAQNFQRVADMQRFRSFRMQCLKTTLAIVDSCGTPDHAAVSVRLKRLDSIRRKLGRTNTNFTLGRLDDVVGVRVICQDLSAVRDFSNRIETSPHSYRLKDYVTTPAATGYRGIHHIMKLEQPVSPTAAVNMRFEVQVRTYLQHRWAVWSESHGEAVKLGVGAGEEHEHLRAVSEEIAQWEANNRATCQVELPPYSGGFSIAVCWRPPFGPVTPYYFYDDIQNAVDWLSYLESTYQAERENGLLLAGVSQTTAINRLLQLTHPLFTGTRVLDPRYWQPSPPA